MEANIAETKRERERKLRLLALKKSVAILDLFLRISSAVAALAATLAMGTTEQTLPFFTQLFQFRASYEDLPAFTFFVIAMSISSGYLVLSVPFSVACVVQPLVPGPRLLLMICDTFIVTLLTSAAASSAAIVYLAHNGNSEANWLPLCQQFGDFCQRISGAVVAGFVAVALLLIMVVLSALGLTKH
ncbi:casparian strip membrane protein 1-like [Salvia hispanica]|uniref:casparian strip membrane protein 1-like n=1 Tax=Salvia hispanica TaxID=49212 RepID=UPI00200912EC|nr:casparian strip membrane protein 1-like [Salvia hispanica]